jgi:acetoin utilization deacetylase AcuC-like enzyme
MRRTALLFFPAFDWAMSPTHPEREERLLYTRDQIFEEGVMDLPQIKEYQPKMSEVNDIKRVHFCVPKVEQQVTDAHLIAAGSSLVVADAVINKEVDNGFVITRPPGHHAMTVVHGNRGFCNINIEAIMIEYLRKKHGIRKLAVIDTDVHHGDGTQEIFYNDPDVLFISFHQDGRTLFPGSGFLEELGTPLAFGTTINIPLSPGTTDVGMHYVLDNLILPALDEFKPELIINSAGQDNHYSDPLASMRFTAGGYAELNRKLCPDIAVLEGGYSVETALPYINMGIVMAMAGIDYSNLREPDLPQKPFKEDPSNLENIKAMVDYQLKNFRSRDHVIEKNRKLGKDFFSYRKQIFYDTEYMVEKQNVKLRVCRSCTSYRVIDSAAAHGGRNYRAFCISIPLYCCDNCRDEAWELYKKMIKQNSDYNMIFIQDRANDSYACREI